MYAPTLRQIDAASKLPGIVGVSRVPLADRAPPERMDGPAGYSGAGNMGDMVRLHCRSPSAAHAAQCCVCETRSIYGPIVYYVASLRNFGVHFYWAVSRRSCSSRRARRSLGYGQTNSKNGSAQNAKASPVLAQQASFEAFLRQPESQKLVEFHHRKLAEKLARAQENRRNKEFRAQVCEKPLCQVILGVPCALARSAEEHCAYLAVPAVSAACYGCSHHQGI